jgi:hypothetical protein
MWSLSAAPATRVGFFGAPWWFASDRLALRSTGYLRALDSVSQSAQLKPVGRAPNAGMLDGKLRLAGADAQRLRQLSWGESLTLTLPAWSLF